MLYNTKGEIVSSFPIQYLFEEYPGIIQYQIIQEGRVEYKMKINVENKFISESKLITELKTYLGKDAVIKVEYVTEIPLLSSGKRKIVINHCLHAF